MVVPDDEDEETAQSVVENGPDPEEPARRFSDLRALYEQTLGSVDQLGLWNPQTQALRQQLGERFLQFRLVPKMCIRDRQQFYHCFGCGAHGNAIGFLMAYERLEFPDAVEELARAAGLDLPQTPGGESGPSLKPLLELSLIHI